MIRILEKHVADKIAAGEVVDRPLSAVKELLENSIDAGADSIVIEIKNGGKTYIRVTDNGHGIASDEIALAFMRHATSKIVSDKDLENIMTLGFRGEALASISSVSRIELLTKREEDKTGTRLIIHGGDVVSSKPFGCPTGTTIIVSDLFYNTPARQKFMKSDSAESSVIIDFVSQMAIAYPHIKFRLINNGNILFSTNGKGDLYNAIATVYSKSGIKDLIPVEFSRGYAHLKGYISSPGISKSSRKSQVFFVNGRVVQSKIIEKGLNEAYKDRLFDGRFPIAYLFLEVDPQKLDVNIHPNKREVRFDDEIYVIEFVSDAIKNALHSKNSIPEVRNDNVFKVKESSLWQESVDRNRKAETQVDIKSLLSTLREIDEKNIASEKNDDNHYDTNDNLNMITSNNDNYYNIAIDNSNSTENTTSVINSNIDSAKYADSRNLKDFRFEDLNSLGSIFGTYILATDQDSFYLIDQHAAHERVFFEKLRNEFLASEKNIQPIIVPLTIEVSHALASMEDSWITNVREFGYEIEPFGMNTYIIKAVPYFMSLFEAESFLNNYLDNIDEKMDFSDLGQMERIISKSCKSAVKGNDVLHDEEINALLIALSKCQNPYSCPHGRPTFIRMRKYEIERIFKRV